MNAVVKNLPTHFLGTFMAWLIVGLVIQSTVIGQATGQEKSVDDRSADEAHQEVFEEAEGFPSASKCQSCHPKQYREWSVSPHAYAQMSPVFNAMSGTIIKLSSGTNGDFCIRCHSPIGMALDEPLFTSNLKRHPASREGITCIVCHRVNLGYGKISGRFGIEKGDVDAPVYGPGGNAILAEAIKDPDGGLVTEPGKPGALVHGTAPKFFQLTQSGFCGICHDVTLVNGFRLEEAFSEYKASPAGRKGITCQQCHMRDAPGVPGEYAVGPAAIVNGKPTKDRNLSNHLIAGPDYSVIHPGLFPFNPEATALATMSEWIHFMHEEGWGKPEFEDRVATDYGFPARWSDSKSRREAREIIDAQQALLAEAKARSKKVLQAGYQLGEHVVHEASQGGLDFSVQVFNATEGHGVPTGFIAERVAALRVTVTDAEGKVVFRSGDLDPNGDVRDLHSVYVHNGELPLDKHLFSLQSKFITRNIRGGEREQVLAVNYSIDPLPYVRPDTRPSILLGRTLGARIHKNNIMPGNKRWARYKVSAGELEGSTGPYKANVKFFAGMVPVNLIYEIMGVGFDYGMSPRDVADAVVAGHEVLWERDIELKTH